MGECVVVVVAGAGCGGDCVFALVLGGGKAGIVHGIYFF